MDLSAEGELLNIFDLLGISKHVLKRILPNFNWQG
jgi:hypothetical protein